MKGRGQCDRPGLSSPPTLKLTRERDDEVQPTPGQHQANSTRPTTKPSPPSTATTTTAGTCSPPQAKVQPYSLRQYQRRTRTDHGVVGHGPRVALPAAVAARGLDVVAWRLHENDVGACAFVRAYRVRWCECVLGMAVALPKPRGVRGTTMQEALLVRAWAWKTGCSAWNRGLECQEDKAGTRALGNALCCRRRA